MFGTEQMKQHGARLATAHRITTGKYPGLLLGRLTDNEAVLIETGRIRTAAVAALYRITPLESGCSITSISSLFSGEILHRDSLGFVQPIRPGAVSPVGTISETFYADVDLAAGASLSLPVEHAERAMFVLDGTVDVMPGRSSFGAGRLVVFRLGAVIGLTATAGAARLMLLGGEPMDGPRHIWWNFVSSSRVRLEQAKTDWKSGRFAMVPSETESIPLPEK